MITFQFKRLKEENLQQLFVWLGLPHVSEWWRESHDWQTFVHKYRKRLEAYDVGSFFIFHEDVSIGYISWYLVARDPIRKEQYPERSYGIDLFIADLNYIGKGYGPEIIKQFIKQKIMPFKPTLILVDPEITNIRAIRVYEKVGFKKTVVSQATDGTQMVTAQLMELDPSVLIRN